VVAGIKKVSDAQIGDTVTETARPTSEPFPGFKELKPMVFAGLYPVEGHEYPELRDALEKLRLNDSSLFYEPETSAALGFGFRCGFLGLLHMEIVQERLEREFDMDLVTTAPGVLYRVTTTDGQVQEIDSPAKLPEAGRVSKIEEPVITATILTPSEHVGGILQLCQDKRGVQKTLEYLASDRVLITYELPFNEVVLDFYDRLKTLSRGYASLDYHVTGYWESPLVKLDILVNAEPVDALVDHRAPRHGVRTRQGARDEDARADSAPDVRGGDPGRDRHAHHRAREREGPAQERARQVLRGRHQPQAQAAREAEGRQAADEARRAGGDPAGSVPGGVEGGRVGRATAAACPRGESGCHDDVQEIDGSRVLRVDRHRGDPRAVHPHVRRAGVQDPDRLDGEQPARRRSPPREQAGLRADPQRPRAGASCRRPDRRGDIVVFKYPEDPERDFIKRVIGLPGETLEVRNKQVYINGSALDEPYVRFIQPPAGPGADRPTTSASATAR
jgi:hypothetical protein